VTHHAAAERRELAATLRATDPAATTLCDPWTAADIAAHLILRGSSARYGVDLQRGKVDANLRDQRRLIDAQSYDALIGRLEKDPRFAPTRFAAIDDTVNLIEYVAHHEDVRRIGADWVPRLLPADRQQAVWSRLRGMTRTIARKAVAGVRLVPTDGWATPIVGAEPTVTVHGDVVELMLVALGRARVARIDLEGDADAVRQFRAAAQMP
jgi:uncharacterized protein (TIGR03085 family)